MKRCAIYTRVSTDHQTHLNQLSQLRTFAGAQGWRVVAEFRDTESGSATERRKEFQAMMGGASRRMFDVVLWWSLDRLTREGAAKTFGYLEQLKVCKVECCDYSNPIVSSTGPEGELFIAISAIWARIEREKIVARTKAGLDRARAQGKRFGRPPVLVDRVRLQDLVKEGLSHSAIAKRLKTSRKTVARRIATL